MRKTSSLTPTPSTIDDHQEYGRLKRRAGIGVGFAIAFFTATFMAEDRNFTYLVAGGLSVAYASTRNRDANKLSDSIEQQMLTSYTQTYFKSGATTENSKHSLSDEGLPLKDVTPKQRAPA